MQAIKFTAVREATGAVDRRWNRFREEMRDGNVILNKVFVDRAAFTATGISMRGVLHSGLLSALAHSINGYGNFTFRGRTGLHELGRFVDDAECIPQQVGAGTDYHPLQSFAYSVMAGIEPDIEIPNSGRTLRTLAINSREIKVAPRWGDLELGHMLFAAAHLFPDPNIKITVDGTTIDLLGLIERVLLAHANIENENSICGLCHATEGLCAVATKVPGAEGIREAVQELLNRQIELLGFIGATIAASKEEKGGCAADMWKHMDYPSSARLTSKVGHLLELAAFAQLLGFEITREQRNTINYVANEFAWSYAAGSIRDDYQHIDFSFSCHFRRGITLLAEIEQARLEGRSLDTVDLTAYRVDFDKLDDVRPAIVLPTVLEIEAVMREAPRERSSVVTASPLTSALVDVTHAIWNIATGSSGR